MKTSNSKEAAEAFGEYLKQLVGDGRQVRGNAIGHDEKEWDAYKAGWDDGAKELLADIAEALMHDLENGVRWLNEKASKDFATKYPNLHKVLNEDR